MNVGRGRKWRIKGKNIAQVSGFKPGSFAWEHCSIQASYRTHGSLLTDINGDVKRYPCLLYSTFAIVKSTAIYLYIMLINKSKSVMLSSL